MFKTHFKGLIALVCTLTMIVSGLIQAPVTAKASGSDYYEPYDGQILMFENGYSGWAMNTMQGSGNGTEIDVYRYDGTTDEKYRVVSKGNGVFWLESVRVPGKYIDRRSDGNICIWEDDNTNTKDLRFRVVGHKIAIEFVTDGKCIAPASKTNATAQTALYALPLDTTLYERLWTVMDQDWNATPITDMQSRINLLYDRLQTTGNKSGNYYYFTQNGKDGGGDATDNCYAENVITANWFINAFGPNVSVTLFPFLHYMDNSPEHQLQQGGHSCFGFACFAAWYLGSNGNTSIPIDAQLIGSTQYSYKKLMDAGVRPGDILHINYDGKSWHTVIVYAVRPDCVEVLQCNFDSPHRGKCAIIRDYDMKYAYSTLGNRTVYIERIAPVY